MLQRESLDSSARAEQLLPLVYELMFDEAFRRLEDESPEAAVVVRLRFFAGLGVEHTAEALGVSTSTVDRRWAFARAWLFRQLGSRTHEEQR